VTWFLDHIPDVLELTWQHLYLAGLPLLLGLVIALPLGWLARRYKALYPPLIIGTGLLYTIPSLALFILLPLFLGTQILDPNNVIIAMTIYTVALLVRTVADGLGAVPDDVNQAATAMGYKRIRRFFSVELPLAVPVISAGMRVAAVSNVSIVSVAAIIGVSQLGSLFTGLIACVLLAVVLDAVILAVTKVLTPWQSVRRARA